MGLVRTTPFGIWHGHSATLIAQGRFPCLSRVPCLARSGIESQSCSEQMARRDRSGRLSRFPHGKYWSWEDDAMCAVKQCPSKCGVRGRRSTQPGGPGRLLVPPPLNGTCQLFRSDSQEPDRYSMAILPPASASPSHRRLACKQRSWAKVALTRMKPGQPLKSGPI